jgi:hypothetical protein
MTCKVLVRLAASRFSCCLIGLFFDFLFAILTHLSYVLRKHLPSLDQVLPR